MRGGRDPRETACPLYFNLARPLLDTNIIQLGIVSRRPSEEGRKGKGVYAICTPTSPGLYYSVLPVVANDLLPNVERIVDSMKYLDT